MRGDDRSIDAADRTFDAITHYVASLEKRAAAFKQRRTFALAFAGFLSAAIIQYDLLNGKTVLFQSAAVFAVIFALFSALIDEVVGGLITEEAWSLTEKLTSVKLGFVGPTITNPNDAIDEINRITNSFNGMGLWIKIAELAFLAMILGLMVGVLSFMVLPS